MKIMHNFKVKKLSLVSLLSICSLMVCYGNVVSNYLPIADPFVMLYDGTYYAYGTSSDDGFEVYTSDDLELWKRAESLALNKKDSYGDKWFWAPEVYYISSQKKFYMYYSTEEHICVATSDSPLGPFVQDEKKPMREEKGIDTSLFIDDDGTPYLYFVRFTNGNVIWVAELEKDLKTIKEETLTQCLEVSQPWETAMAKVIEGPSLMKQDGVYYLLYSGNDYRSPNYGVGFATSSSPLGPWKKYENNPILQKPEPDLVGTGHGAPFLDKDQQYKYIFHAHFDTTTVQPRTSYLKNLSISDKKIAIDGKIIRPKVVE